MNVTFTKLDPTCYNILPIRWDECPEASLSTIGINFSALDAEICNLSFSATNYWNPLYTSFVANSGAWQSVYTVVRDNSACWQSAYLTVKTLSASWLTPLSVIYPETIKSDEYTTATISNWVVENFPIEQGGCVNYVNGQKMRVFTLRYAIEYQDITCRCASQGGSASVRFIGIGTRTVSCGCGCSPGRVKATDRYTSDVMGIEMVVQGGAWVYFRNLY